MLCTFSGASSRGAITVLDYWRLGENDPGAAVGVAATNTTDSVGQNNLQFQGNARYTNDVAPTAENETGSTLSVNFSNSAYATNAIVSTATDNFGIECWVKPTDPSTEQIIAYNGHGSSSGWGLVIHQTNYCGLFGGVVFIGGVPAVANVWTHLALVRASGTTTFYVNGVPAATSTAVPNIAATVFALGAAPQLNTGFLTGSIDEVRVFTFSAGQFRTSDLLLNQHGEITVVSYWRLGENDPDAVVGVTATNTTDSIGLNNLQFQGNARYANDVAPAAASHTGSSLSVNFNTGTYATNAIVSSAIDNFGIECWVKPTALGGGQVIAYNGTTGGAGSGGWGLMIAADNTYEGLYGGATAFGTNVAVANVWTHLALVCAGGNSTLYVNGVPAGSTSSGIYSPSGNFALGAPPQAPTSQFFTGLIDEVRVFTFLPGRFSTNDLLLNQPLSPIVTTAAPTLMTNTTGTLNGTVNPNGLPTTAWFQWGPSKFPYYYTTAVTNLGGGNATLPVSQFLPGTITPGLMYHYRLVASNAVGVVRGPDLQFWVPALTLNGNNPFYLKHQTWVDPGATVQGLPSEFAMGANFVLALRFDGTVVGWGDQNSASEINIPASATNVVAIAAGWYDGLALRGDGTIVGWGDNSYGELNIPAGVSNFVAIAAAPYFSLALRADGTVAGWGESTVVDSIPGSATNVVAIAAGGDHSLALKADGTVIGWGEDELGASDIPAGLTNVVAIATGYEDSVALKADGVVDAWGYDLGLTALDEFKTNIAAIAAGDYHTLALSAYGNVVGWGDNSYGQVSIPAGLTRVVEIEAGYLHSLAMKADGTVVVWGNNSFGQLNVPPGLELDSSVNLPVGSSNNVNTNALGFYQVNYFTTNAYGIATTSRNVWVIDSPTISNLSAVLLATNAADGHRIVRFSASINPNGSTTVVSINYGLTAGYGAVSSTNILFHFFTPQTTTIDVPLSPGFTYHWSVAATNGMDSIPGSAFSSDQTFTVPAAFLPGDINGDGIVDQSELGTVYSSYLSNSPELVMTNVVGLGETNVSFALSNSPLGAYSVEVSTDLIDWQLLGPAIPRYLFTDTNAPVGPQRYYRLRYP